MYTINCYRNNLTLLPCFMTFCTFNTWVVQMPDDNLPYLSGWLLSLSEQESVIQPVRPAKERKLHHDDGICLQQPSRPSRPSCSNVRGQSTPQNRRLGQGNKLISFSTLCAVLWFNQVKDVKKNKTKKNINLNDHRKIENYLIALLLVS